MSSLSDVPEDANANIFLSAHAGRRLNERFAGQRLKATPFVICVHFCNNRIPENAAWVIPIVGGYLVGIWDKPSRSNRYRHTFVVKTVLTEQQFKNNKFTKVKAVSVRIVNVQDQLAEMKERDHERVEAQLAVEWNQAVLQ